jgi:hypothetical protein
LPALGRSPAKVILWKPISRKWMNDQGEEVDDDFLVMREFYVFNAEQTSGLNQYRVGFAQGIGDTGFAQPYIRTPTCYFSTKENEAELSELTVGQRISVVGVNGDRDDVRKTAPPAGWPIACDPLPRCDGDPQTTRP